MLCSVAQSCPTLCEPVDWSSPGSSVRGDSPGKNTSVGCHALLQGIFLTQVSNTGLPQCRWILYHLSHQGSLGINKSSESESFILRKSACLNHSSSGGGFPSLEIPYFYIVVMSVFNLFFKVKNNFSDVCI